MARNVTLRQVADALGVSVMTVSRVINNKANVDANTRQRVLDMAKTMGYTPNHVAKSLVSQKTHTIGVVLPEIHHVFFSEVVSGIEDVVYKNNYQLFLTNSAESEKREKHVIQALRSKRVDGIILSCAQDSTDHEYYSQLVKSGVPLVFFDRCVDDIGASCIRVNDEASSKEVTQHLIEHGYKKIGHLKGQDNVSVARERLDGFKHALKESNLPVNEEWIQESGFSEQGGYNAMMKILSKPRNTWPRAMVAVNDPVAFGAIKAMDEVGVSVPDEIAIVGFSDDIRSELLKCPLTTIRQPAYTIGKKAAEKLINTIEENDEPIVDIRISTKLIVRKSCGCS